MEWFTAWWQGLSLVGQIMACAAIPMTVIMLLQLVLMITGAGFSGGSETDYDSEGEPDNDHPANEAGHNTSSIWRIFTIRGIVAFFALGGWAGLAALSAGLRALWSIQIALLVGVAALLTASLVIQLALKMQDSGNINMKNALSKTAEVYITIPPARTNTGKVTMLLQERFVELEAVTDNESEIRPNTKVEVVALADKGCLLVRPVVENIEQSQS